MNHEVIILGIVIADIIAVVLDQGVNKKIAGKALGFPYYLYILFVNVLLIIILYVI